MMGKGLNLHPQRLIHAFGSGKHPINRILSNVYTPRSQDVTMMGKGLNSGFLASFASGVVERNCKQQSNRHIQGHLNWLFGCSGWGTEPNSAQQVWYVGIQ